jgi:hypothetical protein
VDGPYNVFNAHLRLYQVAVGTKGNATLALIFAAEGGHHDNFDVLCFGG